MRDATADVSSSACSSSPEEGRGALMSPGESHAEPGGVVHQRLHSAAAPPHVYSNIPGATMSTPVTRRRAACSRHAHAAAAHAHELDGGQHADSDASDHYDSVMAWLNQQACGGTVKRKRKINKQQRLAANMRERRRMTSLNSAFEELKQTIPIFPYEKKLSRIQTLRLAIDYIEFMGNILHQPGEPPHGTTSQQKNVYFNNSAEERSPESTGPPHFSPDCSAHVQLQDSTCKYPGY